MSAYRKAADGMTELTVTARGSGKEPNSKTTAAELLERCREFYQDPENEKAFMEWKAGRKAKTAKAVSA